MILYLRVTFSQRTVEKPMFLTLWKGTFFGLHTANLMISILERNFLVYTLLDGWLVVLGLMAL